MTDINNFRQHAPYVVKLHADKSVEILNRLYLPLGLTSKSELEGHRHVKPVLSESGINALKALANTELDGNNIYLFDTDADSPDNIPRSESKIAAYFAKLNVVNGIIYGWQG